MDIYKAVGQKRIIVIIKLVVLSYIPLETFSPLIFSVDHKYILYHLIYFSVVPKICQANHIKSVGHNILLFCKKTKGNLYATRIHKMSFCNLLSLQYSIEAYRRVLIISSSTGKCVLGLSIYFFLIERVVSRQTILLMLVRP